MFMHFYNMKDFILKKSKTVKDKNELCHFCITIKLSVKKKRMHRKCSIFLSLSALCHQC